jgi:hypothetical protein
MQESYTSTGKPAVIIFAQGIWMLISLLTLLFFDLFTIQNHFIISFIGLLSILHVYVPRGPAPRWWLVARLITVVGYIIFAWIIYQRITDVSVLI